MRQLDPHFPNQLSLTYVDTDQEQPANLLEIIRWAREHTELLPAVYIDGEIVLASPFTSRKLIELVRQRLQRAN